jgi:hypothetical protein
LENIAMEICALRLCAEELLRLSKEELAERKTVRPVILLARGGSLETVLFDPRLLQSDGGKDGLFAVVRRRALESGADAMLIAVDSYCLIPNMVRMRASAPTILRGLATEGIDALVSAGLGEKREALAVILQTPIYTLLLEQLYERGDHSLVFGECRRIDSGEQPLEPFGRFHIFSGAGAQRV